MSWVIVRKRDVGVENLPWTKEEFQQYIDYGDIYGRGKFEDPKANNILHQPMLFKSHELAVSRLLQILHEDHALDPDCEAQWWYSISFYDR